MPYHPGGRGLLQTSRMGVWTRPSVSTVTVVIVPLLAVLAWPLQSAKLHHASRTPANICQSSRLISTIISSTRYLLQKLGWDRGHSKPDSYVRYSSREAEQEYWKESEPYRLYVQTSSARYYETIPILTSYEPRLPPISHLPRRKKSDSLKSNVTPKSFCRWHRLVFPDRVSVHASNLTSYSQGIRLTHIFL
jgi:hypothetical protein